MTPHDAADLRAAAANRPAIRTWMEWCLSSQVGQQRANGLPDRCYAV